MFCATTLRYFKGWRHPKNVAVSMKTKDIVKVGNNDFFVLQALLSSKNCQFAAITALAF